MPMRLNHTDTSVAQAQPKPPIGAKPRWPNTSTQLSATLSAKANSATTIMGLVWLMLAL